MTESRVGSDANHSAAAATRAMRRLGEAWGVPLTALSGLDLDGEPSQAPLTEDQAERVGLLLSIYRSLHELWDGDLADRLAVST